MILKIDGEINRTFCQNLCLIFFPGEKFPEKETASERTAVIKVTEDSDTVTAMASVTELGKEYLGEGNAAISDFISRDRARKTAVGNAMLGACVKLLGKRPPWGIMIGVRPAKIGREMVQRGLDKEQMISALMNEFSVSPDKARLLSEVSVTEARAVSLAKENTCSLYISIPFCPTRCAYCSFVSYSTKRYLSLIPEYLTELCKDIRRVSAQIKERGEKLLTVYVGGGTPTVLDEEQLKILIDTVNSEVNVGKLLEFTVEAGRPDTVNAEKFRIMTEGGVTRTSINPQILNDDVLKTIGRRHSTEDFYRAFQIAKESGIRSINTDLIAGLPSSDYGIFSDTLDRIIDLSPDNVTVHTYCVKRSAEFTEKANESGDRSGIYSYSDGDTERCIDYSQSRLFSSGYKPYYLYRQKSARGNLENVGFCKAGYEGLYNIFIMEELQNIYAVGAGAVSKTIDRTNGKIKRISEPKYTYEYLMNRNL